MRYTLSLGKVLKNQERTEKSIENEILAYLERIPVCFAWKNQSVGIFDPIKKIYRRPNNRFHIKGTSDVIGSYNGKVIAIEVKKPQEHKYILKNWELLRKYLGNDKKKMHYREQIEFIEKINQTGGLGFFASSVEDVANALIRLAA